VCVCICGGREPFDKTRLSPLGGEALLGALTALPRALLSSQLDARLHSIRSGSRSVRRRHMHSHCVTRGYDESAAAGSPSPVPVFRGREGGGPDLSRVPRTRGSARSEKRREREILNVNVRVALALIRLDTRCAAGAGAIERTGAADAPQCLTR